MPAAPEPTDEELVRRVRQGDASAATILFDRHAPTLRTKVRHRLPVAVRGKVGESDVIQEAYIAAFVRLGEFEDRGDGSFSRWLRGILAHKIEYEMRRHGEVEKRDVRREVRLATDAERLVGAKASPSPSEQAMADEQSAALLGVVDSLPDDYAAVIRHVHADGMTLVEAGECMGRSADAVRKLYGRALARLAERLRGAAGASE